MCRSCMTVNESVFVKCSCKCAKSDTLMDNAQFFCKGCRHRLMSP